MDVLINIGLGVIGLLLFALLDAKKYFKKGFDINLLWEGVKWTGLWVLLMLILISIVVVYVPDATEPIKNLTGLDIGKTMASFISLGMGLAGLTDIAKK